MQSDRPFYEDCEDAIRAAVGHMGGNRKVGKLLWPDKTDDSAGRLLSDCLNSTRPEKLELTQIMLIFKMAHDAGHHGPFAWFASECGYESKVITKAEEVDRLTTMVEQTSKTLSAALASLQRLQGVSA